MSIKEIIQRIRFAINSIREPVLISRFTDGNGKRKIVVISRNPFGPKVVGKFEILREFSPNSNEPNWEEIGFRSFDFTLKRAVTEPPVTARG